MSKLVCGNSNMRNLTKEDIKNNRSHRCSLEDPCNCCLIKLGREYFAKLNKGEQK